MLCEVRGTMTVEIIARVDTDKKYEGVSDEDYAGEIAYCDLRSIAYVNETVGVDNFNTEDEIKSVQLMNCDDISWGEVRIIEE